MDIFNYTVNFDPTAEPPITFTPGDGAPPFPVNVTGPITLFTFTMSPSAPSGASFLSYPIQWFTSAPPDGLPDTPPPAFMIHVINPQHFAFWDFNSAPSAMSHTFYILIYYDSKIYGQDPTIINQPPST